MPRKNKNNKTVKLKTETVRRLIREERESLAVDGITEAVIQLDEANTRLRKLSHELGRNSKGKPFCVSASMIDEMIDRLLEDVAALRPDED